MRIAMIGAGYVGLVSGACLADFGYEVVCVDTDEHKIAALRAGRVPIYEPGLSELVLANQAAHRLSFTTSLKEAGRSAGSRTGDASTPDTTVAPTPTSRQSASPQLSSSGCDQ
jgi:UDPglucose 6-dehydrogenase